MQAFLVLIILHRGRPLTKQIRGDDGGKEETSEAKEKVVGQYQVVARKVIILWHVNWI